MKYVQVYDTKIGKVRIAEEKEKITEVSIVSEAGMKKDASDQITIFYETPLLKETSKQLLDYLDGVRKKFTLPLQPVGTQFQQKVWQNLQQIPYGETRSYQQIAIACGSPKACRGVGMANHRNPIMIIIPCHRVIGADGSLTGYGGGLPLKAQLLELEKQASAFGKDTYL